MLTKIGVLVLVFLASSFVFCNCRTRSRLSREKEELEKSREHLRELINKARAPISGRDCIFDIFQEKFRDLKNSMDSTNAEKT